MPSSVLVETKVPGQPPIPNYRLSLRSENLSVRDLLRTYIRVEVDRYNDETVPVSSRFESAEEKALNPRDRKHKSFRNPEEECTRAFKAFENNQIMVLINDQQASSLDEMVTVTHDTKVTFLHLVPLVGG